MREGEICEWKMGSGEIRSVCHYGTKIVQHRKLIIAPTDDTKSVTSWQHIGAAIFDHSNNIDQRIAAKYRIQRVWLFLFFFCGTSGLGAA